jgi:hypothetical protein
VTSSGPTRHEYSASLRVTSDTLPLRALVAALGEPSDGFSIGDRASPRLPECTKKRHTSWSLKSKASRERLLEAQIAELASFLEEHREALAAVRADVDVDIFCGVFSGDGAQGGFELDGALLRRLADLDVVVVFDVY